MVDTAQKRSKLWVTTYWTAANVTDDDGVTLANVLFAYDWPDYPLIRVFIDESVDGIISFGQEQTAMIVDSDHYPVGYDEKVPITLCAIDKVGITAIKLLGKMEAELRRIEENYPLGSVRRITGTSPKTERIGSFFLFSIEYQLNYKRDLT